MAAMFSRWAKILAAGVAVLALLTGCGGGGDGGGGQQSVFRIRPGDCFNDPDDGRTLEQVDVVRCDQPHDNEVFATVQHPAEDAAAYPGREALVGFAEQACTDPFAAYVGAAYAQSRFSLFPIVPSEVTWNEGDRQVICALYDHQAGQITGSMRGTAQ